MIIVIIRGNSILIYTLYKNISVYAEILNMTGASTIAERKIISCDTSCAFMISILLSNERRLCRALRACQKKSR